MATSNEPPEDWKPFLGRKVSIRYRLHGDPDHPFSEAIGVIKAVHVDPAGDSVEILGRRGQVASVATADVLAAKIWPVG